MVGGFRGSGCRHVGPLTFRVNQLVWPMLTMAVGMATAAMATKRVLITMSVFAMERRTEHSDVEECHYVQDVATHD